MRPVESTSFQRIRRSAAESLAVALLLAGFLAYVPSVWRAVTEGYWSVVAIDTAALGVLLFIMGSRRRMPYSALSSLLVGIVWLLGAGLLALLGTNGSGHQWMAGGCALAGLLTGPRTTVATLVALAAWSVLAALSFGPTGLIGGSTPLAPWWVYAANSAAIAVGVSIPTLFVVRALRDATASAERQAAELASDRAALERALATLQAEASERRAVEERLRRSERLGAIGALAASVAHDFNNLLTPILLSSQALGLGEEDGPRRELIHAIEASALRGRDLVARIVTFASAGTRGAASAEGALEGVADASHTLDEACALLRASLPPGVGLHCEIGRDLGKIPLAPADVQRVVLNVGANASRALAGRGTIRVVARRAPEGRVLLEIADDGPGMAPEVLARAFDPFFTTHRADGGSGLGLATVHAIVEAAGGEVALRSAPGQGCAVVVSVPSVVGA